jgi:hypothetical protein
MDSAVIQQRIFEVMVLKSCLAELNGIPAKVLTRGKE